MTSSALPRCPRPRPRASARARARAPGRPRPRPPRPLTSSSFQRPLPTSRALAPDSPDAQSRRGASTPAANQRALVAPRPTPISGLGKGPRGRRAAARAGRRASLCGAGVGISPCHPFLRPSRQSADSHPSLGGTLDNKGERGGRQTKGRHLGRRRASTWGKLGTKPGSWEEEGHKPKTCPGQDVPLSSVESPNLKPVPVVCASQSLPSPQGPPGVRDPLQLDPGRETVLT